MGDLLKHVSQKIRELREAHALSQEELAEKVDVTQNTVSRWESGKYKPKLEDLERIARTFNKPIWALLPVEAAPPSPSYDALLSATGDLPEEDIEELVRYAEFVRARRALKPPLKRGTRSKRGNR